METLPQPSRHLGTVPGIHAFGGLSNFLRSALADEDGRALSDGIGELALQVEGVAAVLGRSRRRSDAAPALVDLLTVLRRHRALVLDLGLGWRGLYEHAAYLQSVDNFRIRIGQWLQAAPWEGELEVTAAEFQSVAWRTLGDGMLLMDMYEQWLDGEAAEPAPEPQPEKVRQWWHKLRR